MHSKSTQTTIVAITLLSALLSPSFSQVLQAGMTSSSYRIDWDTLSTGGSDTSSSASYGLQDTLGSSAVGDSSSASYNLRAGYRQNFSDQAISFDLFAEDASKAAAAASLAGTTITVSSTENFNVGDYVILATDIGEDQVSGMGQITGKTATTLTLDELADNGTAPTVDGSDDWVYLLSGSAIDFGTLSTQEVSTSTIGWNVTLSSGTGYSIQVASDGALRSSSFEVSDVSDGQVSAGSEEYGGRSSDTTISGSTFDSEDTAIPTTLTAVTSVSGTASNDRHFLTLKASMANGTPSGSYSQTLTLVATGNY